MQDYIDQRLKKIIKKIIQNNEAKSLLIAISGGQDSICLIKLIEKIKEEILYNKIEYIYIDHQWKKNSRIQIEHIIKYCKKLKINLSIYQIKKITLSENIARRYRYHTLINHAIIYRYKTIITAHTKTDKLETFIYNLIRGTGIEGIKGLNLYRKVNSKISILRPLIYENRLKINFFCRKWFLPIWSDTTNYNYHIIRNRIRHEIFPYIKKYLNKNFEKNIINFLYNFHYDNEYIKQQAFKIYLKIKHNKYIAIKTDCIKKQHIALQVKILQLFIYHNFYIIITKKLLFNLIVNVYNIDDCKYIYYKNIIFCINDQWIYIKIKY